MTFFLASQTVMLCSSYPDVLQMIGNLVFRISLHSPLASWEEVRGQLPFYPLGRGGKQVESSEKMAGWKCEEMGISAQCLEPLHLWFLFPEISNNPFCLSSQAVAAICVLLLYFSPQNRRWIIPQKAFIGYRTVNKYSCEQMGKQPRELFSGRGIRTKNSVGILGASMGLAPASRLWWRNFTEV